MASGEASPAWYVAEGKRGQQLLDQGRVDQATEVFAAALARIGDAPSYGRAVMLERLGRCFHLGGRSDVAGEHLRDAIGVARGLAPRAAVKRLLGTLQSELGDALRAMGRYGEARKAYEAALKIAEALQDPRARGVDLGHLGGLALAEGELEEALARYRAALALFQPLHEPALEAVAWHQLGRVFHERREWAEAERHYREAARIGDEGGSPAAAAQSRTELAVLLQDRPTRLGEARRLAEEALAIGQSRDPVAAEAWTGYGLLAGIAEREAATTADGRRKAALQAQARDYRQLRRYAPRIVATLARLGDAPSFGRAVMLGQVGRCLSLGGRPDLAAGPLREAWSIAERLAPGEDVEGLYATLRSSLGNLLHASGRHDDASETGEEARPVADDGSSPFDVVLFDDLVTDYVFDTDLLVDGPRERRVTRWTGEADPPADHLRPVQPAGARSYLDDEGAIRFHLPPAEPALGRHPGCTVMRHTRREVAVSGSSDLLWRLIREMDGARTVGEIVSGLPSGERAVAARLLAVLAATGAVDLSGRPIARFVHSVTKKGVLPGGGLESEEVLRLATDESYRAFPAAPRIAIGRSVPDRLRAFHALTRSRRSRRDYPGLALSRDDFDALLVTACGVTGAMSWAGREVKLRAYPSSGALYAVEVYPVVFRVEGLDPTVYHYRAVENVLEVVRPGIDRARIVGAALPVEREMVAGAAAMICLTGVFPRHERKYGEGGYRMLVAEAGHISQNLILAATALGLSARPFGGVFDDLLNDDLGLEAAQEQFLLAVIVGHSRGNRSEGTPFATTSGDAVR